MPQNAFFPRTRDLLVSQKIMETLFFAIHPLSPVIFAVATLVALVLLVNSGLNLLYTVWSNAYSEIGPEVTLQPHATSCAKDYKGHSLVQTSFIEPPNRQRVFEISTEVVYLQCCLVVTWLKLAHTHSHPKCKKISTATSKSEILIE